MVNVCSRVSFGHFSQEPGEKIMFEFLQWFSTDFLHSQHHGGTDTAMIMCVGLLSIVTMILRVVDRKMHHVHFLS